jgi:hypothetical protein
MDDAPSPFPQTEDQARRRQRAYARKRRLWAEAVGRPYVGKPDVRPPPGEVDAEADE